MRPQVKFPALEREKDGVKRGVDEEGEKEKTRRGQVSSTVSFWYVDCSSFGCIYPGMVEMDHVVVFVFNFLMKNCYQSCLRTSI